MYWYSINPAPGIFKSLSQLPHHSVLTTQSESNSSSHSIHPNVAMSSAHRPLSCIAALFRPCLGQRRTTPAFSEKNKISPTPTSSSSSSTGNIKDHAAPYSDGDENGNTDCVMCRKCHDCHDCVSCNDCKDCNGCVGCWGSTGLKNCTACVDCVDCEDCVGVKGLKGAKNVVGTPPS